MSSHNLNSSASTLAEIALVEIMGRDSIVLAERAAIEAGIVMDEMRAKMRARALAREAAKRSKRDYATRAVA